MGDFEKLKGMRVDDIYNKTYLAHKNIEAILNKEFDKLNKFKTTGFIGILEKSYNLDLSELKKEAEDYYNKLEEDANIALLKTQEEEPVKTYDKRLVWIFAGVVFVLILVILLSSDNNEQSSTIVQKNEETASTMQIDIIKDESAVVDEVLENSSGEDELEESATSTEDVKEEKVVVEIQESKKLETEVVIEQKEEQKVSVVAQSIQKITITPTRQIWLGVIYLDDYSKREYLTSSEIGLDTSRNQLILAGHGHLKVTIDGNDTTSSDDNRIRFLLQDGELKMIKRQDFRDLNKGKDW
ncbi:hypothetical protein [Arcobacter sp. FWKO B]|uniref:hypothetical protein n=1 Tax=Arcobacter sp. FWKO B TaxID=2593672 RepID=UPI0018A5A2F3|nr:hypothetical protein [Arcobacter sp. FWKO B]QOG12325.1 hypothetical protein FWKOB_06275 [Arcobacter sp. FWKO B]